MNLDRLKQVTQNIINNSTRRLKELEIVNGLDPDPSTTTYIQKRKELLKELQQLVNVLDEDTLEIVRERVLYILEESKRLTLAEMLKK